MGVLLTVVFGGITGWLASVLLRTNSHSGVAAYVVAGVVGAFLADGLARVAGLGVEATAGNWAVAMAGAAALTAVLRRLGVFKLFPAWR